MPHTTMAPGTSRANRRVTASAAFTGPTPMRSTWTRSVSASRSRSRIATSISVAVHISSSTFTGLQNSRWRLDLASWLRSRTSPICSSASPSSITSPTADSRCRCSSRSSCSGRCSSRAKPASARPSLAAAAAAALDTDLIRLQCYEGLDVSHAVYEWDYARQILELRILDAAGGVDRAKARQELYSDAFLIKRPLLQAIDPRAHQAGGPVDRRNRSRRRRVRRLPARAAVGVPDHDSRARHGARRHPPLVILTSNRTREVHDALKRRCLYQWIDYPSFEKELAIVHERVPHASSGSPRR